MIDDLVGAVRGDARSAPEARRGDHVGACALRELHRIPSDRSAGAVDEHTLAGFEASCFDGVYVTGDIDTDAIQRMNGGRPRVEETEEDSSRLVLPNAS